MPDLQFCKELPEIKPGEYRLKYDLTLRVSPGLELRCAGETITGRGA